MPVHGPGGTTTLRQSHVKKHSNTLSPPLCPFLHCVYDPALSPCSVSTTPHDTPSPPPFRTDPTPESVSTSSNLSFGTPTYLLLLHKVRYLTPSRVQGSVEGRCVCTRRHSSGTTTSTHSGLPTTTLPHPHPLYLKRPGPLQSFPKSSENLHYSSATDFTPSGTHLVKHPFQPQVQRYTFGLDRQSVGVFARHGR